MALVCTSNINYIEDFEFIDCSTISISYSQRGIASVSLTIVSTRETLLNDYSSITLDGVDFQLTLRDLTVSLIPGTLVYMYQMNLTGFGC
jgi:hypothetical protein